MTAQMKWTLIAIACFTAAGVANYFDQGSSAAGLLSIATGIIGKEYFKGSKEAK